MASRDDSPAKRLKRTNDADLPVGADGDALPAASPAHTPNSKTRSTVTGSLTVLDGPSLHQGGPPTSNLIVRVTDHVIPAGSPSRSANTSKTATNLKSGTFRTLYDVKVASPSRLDAPLSSSSSMNIAMRPMSLLSSFNSFPNDGSMLQQSSINFGAIPPFSALVSPNKLLSPMRMPPQPLPSTFSQHPLSPAPQPSFDSKPRATTPATKAASNVKDGANGNLSSLSSSSLQKRCHCKQSKCLKLYCDCFASGEYCSSDCKCANCSNNESHDSERRDAVKQILDRTPNAFRAKETLVTDDTQNPLSSRGCRCTKSRCLKRYCECFQAGLMCSSSCSCVQCLNTEGSMDRVHALHPHGGSSSSTTTPNPLLALDQTAPPSTNGSLFKASPPLLGMKFPPLAGLDGLMNGYYSDMVSPHTLLSSTPVSLLSSVITESSLESACRRLLGAGGCLDSSDEHQPSSSDIVPPAQKLINATKEFVESLEGVIMAINGASSHPVPLLSSSSSADPPLFPSLLGNSSYSAHSSIKSSVVRKL